MSWNDGNNGGAAAAADPWGAAPAGDAFAAAGNDDFNTAPAHEAGGANEYDDHGNGDDGQANGFDGGGGDRACFGCGQPGFVSASDSIYNIVGADFDYLATTRPIAPTRPL